MVLAAAGIILYRRKKKAAAHLAVGSWDNWEEENVNTMEENEP